MLHKNNITSLQALFESDPARARDFCLEAGHWLFDYARVPIGRDALDGQLAKLHHPQWNLALDALFSGAEVNVSECQSATHMDWRQALPPEPGAQGRVCSRFEELATALHSGSRGLTDLIHVGIGGSDLGPRLVTEALDREDSAVRVHWLAGLDPRRLHRLFNTLDASRTGLVIASKSFTTSETLVQARAVIDWLGADWDRRSWAATANPRRAGEMGFADAAILPFDSTVGGRYSLWTTVGLSAAARIGPARWRELLKGASACDQQLQADWVGQTMAGRLALILNWVYTRGCFDTLAVISYEPRLGLLADYLQQLIMESLGKSVTANGEPSDGPDAPLVFGGRGTELQHSVFQALHQGRRRHPVLLVGSCRPEFGREDWQREQLANLLAQAQALAFGRQQGPAHQRTHGENPVLVLLAEALSPHALGWLLASLEHTVYLLGRFWNLNPFDQWGVEEGKRLAAGYCERLAGRSGDDHASSQLLIEYMNRASDPSTLRSDSVLG